MKSVFSPKHHCLVSYREVLGRVQTFADNQKTNMASANKWHWSCASKYCKNYWRTPEISYHRLTKVQRASKKAIDQYVDVIGCKTKEKVKRTRAVLCSAHWSKQPAMVEVDLPDVKFTTGARQVLKQVINEFDHFFVDLWVILLKCYGKEPQS